MTRTPGSCFLVPDQPGLQLDLLDPLKMLLVPLEVELPKEAGGKAHWNKPPLVSVNQGLLKFLAIFVFSALKISSLVWTICYLGEIYGLTPCMWSSWTKGTLISCLPFTNVLVFECRRTCVLELQHWSDRTTCSGQVLLFAVRRWTLPQMRTQRTK